MGEIIRCWITAEVTLLPRKDGRRQRPPCIFGGYRNSNLRFEGSGDDGYDLPRGGARLYPVDHDQLNVGETGLVYMEVWGESTADPRLRVGTHFLLTEGG